MIIAAFGDVHGEIDLLYQSCQDWQRKTRTQIDLILQTGDLGVCWDLEHLDAASKKKSKENPLELKLHHLLKNPGEFEELLSGSSPYSAIKAKLLFVRGNHDDQAYLERLAEEYSGQSLIPLNGHLSCIRDASPLRLYQENTALTLAGLGGIDPKHRPKKVSKDPRIAFTPDQTTNALACENLDIFLTHMYPQEHRYDGSPELSELISLIQPKVYLFGHFHYPSHFQIGETECFGLSRVCHPTTSNITDHSMLILEKKGQELKVISQEL